MAIASVVIAWAGLRRLVVRAGDVLLYDETVYLGQGALFLRDGTLPSAVEGSPLYAIWYAVWLAVTGDPVAAYWTQWLATDLALALMVFAVQRAAQVGRAFAALGTGLWLLLPVTSVGWPRVYFFAFLLVLGGVIVDQRCRSYVGAVGLGIGILLATLVRGEYLLALLGIVAAHPARRWISTWRRRALAAVMGIATSTLVLFNTSCGGGRLWLAFIQHHAVRHAQENPGILGDPWFQATELAARVFPGATSVCEAVRANPARSPLIF